MVRVRGDRWVIERGQPEARRDGETAARQERYRERETRFRDKRDELKRRWNRVGNLRLLGFAVAIGFALAGWQASGLFFVPAGSALVAFVALVVWHRNLGRALARAAALHAVNHEALLRAARDWEALPLRHPEGVAPGHPFAQDLDLFGTASLFHLLETVTTSMGADCLRRWLIAPAEPIAIAGRQVLVRELAPELEWRQELEVRGRLIGDERPDPAPLLAWAEGVPWLLPRTGLRLLGVIGPIGAIVTAVAAGFGVLPWLVCIAFGALNLITTQVLGAEAKARIGLVAEHERAIGQYAQLLSQSERLPGRSVEVAALRERLTAHGRSASASLETLGRRAAFAVPPGTALYLPLQGLFAWDLNVLARIEAWQAEAGGRARDWLATIGEIEALTALATLAHDNPTWAFPAVAATVDAVTAENLGHPLLADGVRVCNDVTVGPPGTFLFVTGSNMSGKSTLLRGIGVNLVLAGAGGPVCASAFTAPPVRLWTSVRVEDSLARGVSFFMAELQRLKQVVDAATTPDPEGCRLFYQLDEILQGTNTAERQIAARRVIRHLVEAGAIGAVSTHDLNLAEGAELGPFAHPVHLRDRVTATGMSFDYKVRPGVATSTNALRLMEMVFGEGAARTCRPT
jgi:hypothetical protein